MKREDAMKLAEQALDELGKALQQGRSDTLKQLVEVMARFPNYSFNNVMLIAVQRPDATHVAGFRTWKRLGRQVLKGEKGIAIVAPMAFRHKDAQTQPVSTVSQDGAEQILCGFRVVHVFDISQTEGAELPELARPHGDPGTRLCTLEAVITRLGIALEYAPLSNGTLGLSLKGKIVVKPGLEPAETFAVLAHELAHELLHQPSEGQRPEKNVRELEAEAVAQAVCHAFGIDSTASSSDYIQIYDGNHDVLAKSLQTIQKTAAQIIVEMSRDPEQMSPASLAALAA